LNTVIKDSEQSQHHTYVNDKIKGTKNARKKDTTFR